MFFPPYEFRCWCFFFFLLLDTETTNNKGRSRTSRLGLSEYLIRHGRARCRVTIYYWTPLWKCRVRSLQGPPVLVNFGTCLLKYSWTFIIITIITIIIIVIILKGISYFELRCTGIIDKHLSFFNRKYLQSKI